VPAPKKRAAGQERLGINLGNSRPESVKAALDAVGESDGSAPFTRYTLVNGVVLAFKQVPALIVQRAQMAIPRPEVPKVYIEDQDRFEENPNDPAYAAALNDWLYSMAEAELNVGLMLGVEIEHLPDGMFKVDDDDWIDDALSVADVMGIDLGIEREKVRGRWLDYLRYYIITSEEDLMVITRAVSTRVALSEADVQTAVATFRRNARRFADLGRTAAADALFGGEVEASDPGDGA
jgi:hypothetical protein